MRSVRVSRLSVVFTAGVISVLAAPVLLSAQAWLPPKGDGSVSFGVQTISFDGHFDTAGNKLPVASSRATNLLLGLSYSFTDKFAVDLSVPYVITKYTGDPALSFLSRPLSMTELRIPRSRIFTSICTTTFSGIHDIGVYRISL